MQLNWQAGVFRIAGAYGQYWSSWTDTSDKDKAYNLYFDTGINPSNGPASRWVGRSLRCLSADLEG